MTVLDDNILSTLARLDSASDIHQRRLGRAFQAFQLLESGHEERSVHCISRLGVWADGLAQALSTGEVGSENVIDQLTALSRLGKAAFHHWMEIPAEPSEATFGRYLATVAERDVDLLLMEEFHANSSFVQWFSSQIGEQNGLFAGAWHSVTDADGETDLLLRLAKAQETVGVLIENKIGAPEQREQAARYHLRGARSQQQGKFDRFVTVMCAPQRYLDALSAESLYEHRVSYEVLVTWFSNQFGARAKWRTSILQEAIEQGRRGYTMIVHAGNTAFHRDYFDYISIYHPKIWMAEPKNKGGKSNWIILKGHDFPKGVMIHHKIDQRRVELGFNRKNVDDIIAACSEWPDEISVVQKGGVATLSTAAPEIDMNKKFAEQIQAVERAIQAVYKLMPFASLFVENKDSNRDARSHGRSNR